MSPSSQPFDEILQSLSPEDFDGHTDFEKLTLEERLAWLSNIARFLWAAKQGTGNK